MRVSVDISWKSLNKHHEELCGDKVEVLKTDDSEIIILADGDVYKRQLIHCAPLDRQLQTRYFQPCVTLKTST